MNMVIAANYNDVSNVKNAFSCFTRIKGTFPKIKCCHDLVNEHKYILDSNKKSGGINPEYPKNILHDIKDLLDEYDIIIIPIDSKLIAAVTKYKKIKRVCVYEPNPENSTEMKEMIW